MADAATEVPAAVNRQIWLARYEQELPRTLKVLRAFPSDQGDFRPHERSQPAVRIAHTLSQANAVMTRTVRGETKSPPSLPPTPKTFEEATTAYERSGRELIEAARTAPEDRFAGTVPFGPPGKLAELPVMDLLWMMLLDSIHHRGQLSVYNRLAGGTVPSIYGPSGDEPLKK
jgi:uncharacterized damage-inducible protein DinB